MSIDILFLICYILRVNCKSTSKNQHINFRTININNSDSMKTNLFFTIFLAIIFLASCKKENIQKDSIQYKGDSILMPLTLIDSTEGFSFIESFRDREIDMTFYLHVYPGERDPNKGDSPSRTIDLTYNDGDVFERTEHVIRFRSRVIRGCEATSLKWCRYAIKCIGHINSWNQGQMISSDMIFTSDTIPWNSHMELVNGENPITRYLVFP